MNDVESQYQFNEQKVNEVCQSLAGKMMDLEAKRINVRKRLGISYIVLVVLLLASAVGIYLYSGKSIWTIVIIIGGAAVAYFIFYFSYIYFKLSSFKEEFKFEVIRGIVLNILPCSVYKADNHVSMNEYSQSGLFTKDYDRFSGANFVSGTVDRTEIVFSDLHTEYKEVTNTKNGTRTTWHTIFQGVFMVADSNKNFKGRTFILPDTGEQLFGSIGKWFQKNMGGNTRGGEMVYMENRDFEKRFVVYATDPVEARYLITPKMQERMLELSKHSGAEVRVSFVGGKLFLALNGRNGLFALNMKLPLTDINTMKYYSRDLTDMLTIVEILDLNTRIWGKE